MKYTRYVLQLLLAVPFYYVSMVLLNVILSTVFEIWGIATKYKDKITIESFKGFSIETNNLLKYNTEFNIFYIVIGLFLSYYLIFLPLKSLYVEIGSKGVTKSKKETKDGLYEGQEKEEREKLSAFEVLNKKSKKDLGDIEKEEQSKNKFTEEEYKETEKDVDDVDWLEEELNSRGRSKSKKKRYVEQEEEPEHEAYEPDFEDEIDFELIEDTDYTEEAEYSKVDENEERKRVERKRLEKEEREKVAKKFMEE